MSITLDQAEQIITAGKRKASEMGIPMTIAVCDPGGNLVALSRMDNAILASLDYAIGKAYTAIAMNMNTADLTPYVQPGQFLYGLQVGHQPRPLVIFAGGLPLKMNGQLVGGVGVSGGLPDQDGQVAAAAAAMEELK